MPIRPPYMDIVDSAWRESIREGITNANLSHNSQKATLTGYFTRSAIDPYVPSGVSANTWLTQAIIGNTVKDQKGGLNRVLPVSHPEFPWLFATDVSISGIKFDSKATALNAFNESAPFGYYAQYVVYKYGISFNSLPYILLTNAKVPVTSTLTWYDDNGTTKTTSNVPWEWWRYTDFEEVPSAEYLSAETTNQMFYQRSDSLPPNTYPIQGKTKILDKRSTIKFRWYQVPYSYITSSNSFIKAAQGKINQFDWYGFPKGTLRFESINYNRYTPLNPGQTTWTTGVVSNEKLCDIEFIFSYFNPTTLTGGKAPSAPANNNHITAGHNLFAWLGGRNGDYFYTAGGSDLNYSPLFKSYPFELMFRDPDVA